MKQERVRKGTTFGEFKQQLAKELNIDPEKQRFWTFAKRQNNTMRYVILLLQHGGAVVQHHRPHLGHDRMYAQPYSSSVLTEQLKHNLFRGQSLKCRASAVVVLALAEGIAAVP